MSLFDVFFPEVSEAQSLRRIANSMGRRTRRASRPERPSNDSSPSDDDVELLMLVMMTALQQLFDKGVLNREEFVERLQSIDRLDGVEDGRIDPVALRAMLGIAAPPPPAKPEPPITTPLRTKRRR